MANEDLKRFMVERLLALDPSLSDDTGARMYTTVIDPLVKRLGTDPLSVDIRQFIEDRMAAEYPDLDVVSPGSALADTLVGPLQILLEPLRREIISLRDQRSLADPTILNEDELDALLGNIFAIRRTGDFARGVQRVYYNSRTAVGVDNSIVFSTSEGIAFVPDVVRTYGPNDMRRSGGLFYLDIPIRSIEPVETANVDPNTIRFVRNLDGVVRTTNLRAIRFGVARETNETFSDRAGRALTERSTNTSRGIETSLLDTFSDLVSVATVGYGEPEMQRDILQADVVQPAAEVAGSLIYSSANFKTERTFDLGTSGGDDVVMPFTNLLRVVSPPAAKVAAIKAAKYLRVSDGNGHYTDNPLGRLRGVKEVTDAVDASGDLIIRLTDFEVFPNNADEATASAPFLLITAGADFGLNQYSTQGGDFSLIGHSGAGAAFVRGARLPFSDFCGATLSASARPGAVEPGRDFIITASAGTEFVTAAHPMPRRLWALPLDGLIDIATYRIARADALANLRERVSYTDQASYVYDTSPGALGFEARPRIIDFGCPMWTSLEAERSDGVSKDVWSRNPGVKLTMVVKDTPATPAVTYDAVRDVLVELEATQASWADRGVVAGQFIALTVYSGPEGAGPDPFTGGAGSDVTRLKWHGWGRIVALHTSHQLHVAGVDVAVLGGITHEYNRGGFVAGASATYSFAWTIFENSRQMVTPDGRLVTSYDEFNFFPAYQIPTGEEGFVFAPMPAGFEGDLFNGDTDEATNKGFSFFDPNGAFWIRLAKPLQAVHPSMGGVPALSLGGGVVVDLEAREGDPGGFSQQYAERRYTEAEPVQVDAGDDHSGLVQFRQGPVVSGAQQFDGQDPTGWTRDTSHLVNSKGMQGFLLPHPMGSAHTGAGETYEGILTGDNNLTNQVVQLYADGAVEVSTNNKIVVSGIPGSVPFPTVFSGPLEIEDNEVHLGGLTDVYAKFGSETLETADRLLLKPRDLANTLEVIASGASGSINFAEPTQFLSLALEGAIEERFDMGGNVEWAHDLVVELIEPPAAIQPKSFRVTNNIAGGVQTDVTFTGGEGLEPNLRWQLVQQVTVDLERPVEVMQQGADMRVLAGALQATFPAGVLFSEGVSDRGMVIKIASGPNEGEYEVTTKGGTTLGVRTPFPATETAINYQVLALQNTRVQLPLVRVKSVSLAGEHEGVPIPYRHPVELRAGAFAGLNDDPLTDESTDDGVLSCDGTFPATFVAGATDWEALGVLKYDVLRIDGVDAALTYWYVVGVGQDKNGDPSATSLLLDRVVTATTLSTLSFTLGHPSVGTVTARFMQRTMFEASQATVFTVLDSDGVERKFRPSPAESAKLYEAPVGITYVTTPVDSAVEFSAVVNPFAAGVAVGDRVDVLSEVLTSSGLGATEEVQGKLLAFTVNDASRLVRFTGTDPLTPNAIAADFNRQAGDVLRASAVGGELLLASRHHLQLVDAGSTGILDELGFPNADDRNNRTDASTSFGTFYVASIAYTDATQVTRLTLETPAGDEADTLRVNLNGAFVDIIREGAQRLYPAGLAEDSIGLFSGEMKLTSMDPLESQVVASDTQMEATGYESLGFELVVENANYSYSMGEKVGLRCTPIVLDEFSTGMLNAYAVVGAGMTIQYEWAPGIDAMQTFLLLPAVRVQCHNPLARHFFPAYPAFNIAYRGTPTTEAVKQAVGSFLASRYPNKEIATYDIVKTVSALNVVGLDLPQEVAVLAHDASRRVKLRSSLSKLDLGNQFHIMGDVTGVTVTKS